MARTRESVPQCRECRRVALNVVLSVGTHEQQFDRLVDLADRLADSGHMVKIQYGYSKAPILAEGVDFVPAGVLSEWMAQADIVFVHGGPATVLQALSQGKMPVVVPRDPGRGEHVDGHQLSFAQHLQKHDLGIVMVNVATVDLGGIVDRSTQADLCARAERVRENRSRIARSLDEWLGVR